MKYLWAHYLPPEEPDTGEHPFDFTWEREWRMQCTNPKGLEVVGWRDLSFKRPLKTSIIVGNDTDVGEVRACLNDLATSGRDFATSGRKWAARLRRIFSLETAKRELARGDTRYAKIETWPDE
jgi:hypothetical protein